MTSTADRGDTSTTDAGGPTVSVIVANYNAARFLDASLRSILAQGSIDLEVVLVDDVSTDDGLAVARRIAAADDRLRVVAMPRNGGPAAARNRALALARGRWVAIVDSDDLLHPDRLARLVAAADAAGADMVADDLLVFNDGSAAVPTRFLKPADRAAAFDVDLADYLRRSVLYSGEPNLGFLKPLIRSDRLVASGVGYDETLRIAEDDDFVVRLLLAGLRYVVVPTPWYFYRKHGGSISHRLSLAAVEAILAADARLRAAIVAARPALRAVCDRRHRAFARAAAFEALILALRRRDAIGALRLLARHPATVPMLRMPLAGLWRKLAPSRKARTVTADAQQQHLLACAADAGA